MLKSGVLRSISGEGVLDKVLKMETQQANDCHGLDMKVGNMLVSDLKVLLIVLDHV